MRGPSLDAPVRSVLNRRPASTGGIALSDLGRRRIGRRNKAQNELGLFELEKKLDDARRELIYHVNDYTVEVLSNKFNELDPEEGDLFIPGYQRKLVWNDSQKSYFIESLLIRVPVPPVFLFDVDGRLEIVDGSQRLRSIHEYMLDRFALRDLEKLDFLNGYHFSDLPIVVQRRLKNTSIRSFLVLEGSDDSTRFDLFRRVNTSGRRLTSAELRRGLFPGPFLDMIRSVSTDDKLKDLAPIARGNDPDGEREELALRFFAYSDEYETFVHDVERFLNEYLKRANLMPQDQIAMRAAKFTNMISYVNDHFPYGFRRARNVKITPRVRFEAISVGVHLAMQSGIQDNPDLSWLDSSDFNDLVRTDASNSGPKLRSRIEFVRDKLTA